MLLAGEMCEIAVHLQDQRGLKTYDYDLRKRGLYLVQMPFWRVKSTVV